MDDAGNEKADLKIPKDDLGDTIESEFAGGKELVLTVLKV